MQLGQVLLSFSATHFVQKVHSNEHIMALCAVGGKSLLQHSQLGLSCSILPPVLLLIGITLLSVDCGRNRKLINKRAPKAVVAGKSDFYRNVFHTDIFIAE